MFDPPESLLRSTKGTLKERPLPLLFHALFAARRTAGLELKRQALEKVLVFEMGAPVGCSSNLVHESIGRFLVEKKALTEDQYLKVLGTSARRGVRFEKVVLEETLLDLATLQKLMQANLAQRFFDAFRWTDGRYRILGDVEIDPDAPRMNAPQMLVTALCNAVPEEVIHSQLGVSSWQRFALVHEPKLKLEDLKLNPRDANLAELIKERKSLAELSFAAELSEDAVRRRLFAFGLLGCVDLAEKVPVEAPTPLATAPMPVATPIAPLLPLPVPTAPNPELLYVEELRESSRRRRRIVALLASGLLVVVAGAVGIAKLVEPKPGPVVEEGAGVVFEEALRPAPNGTPLARIELPPLPIAPLGAKAQAGRPRALFASASGIPLEPPEPLVGRSHLLSTEASRLLALGKAGEARVFFEQLLKSEPKDARLPYGLALAAYLEGKDEESRGLSLEALQIAPEFADAHLLAGFLEQLAGKAPEAIAHYQAFLKSEAASPRAEDVRTLIDRLGATR